PRAPAIVGFVNTAIRSCEHVIRVLWIDPHRVKVAVNPANYVRRPGLAAVIRDEHGRGELPDALIVVRIDPDLAVVHRPRIRVAHLAPVLATIFRTKNSAFRILDDRVNDVRRSEERRVGKEWRYEG